MLCTGSGRILVRIPRPTGARMTDVKSKFAGAAVAAVLTLGVGSVGLAMAQEATDDSTTTTTTATPDDGATTTAPSAEEAPSATAPDDAAPDDSAATPAPTTPDTDD